MSMTLRWSSRKRSRLHSTRRRRRRSHRASRRCRPGYHLRKGYTRKGGVHVPSVCIKHRGIGGQRVIPKLHKGKLTRFGYRVHHVKSSRRRALGAAIHRYGATAVWRMLNAQALLQRNQEPALAKRFRVDRNWVKKTHMR